MWGAFREVEKTYDIIIVGGGIAGLSAAVYASRAGKKTLLIEKSLCGGQIVNSPKVENYPGIVSISGYELSAALYEQAESFGCEITFDEVLEIYAGDVKKVRCALSEYEAYAVILATGAQKRKLGLENEEKFTGRGVSYCATCDGSFFRGKKVAVVGGGNTALDDALYLSEICAEVTLIHRRDEFRGNARTLEKLKSRENVKMITGYTVSALGGEDRLSEIEIAGVTDKAKRMRIEVNGIFIAVGSIPDTGNFSALVELDEGGYFNVDESCATNHSGIFVAGDCRAKNVRQLATAASDGVIAAIAAADYISHLE